MKRIHKLGILSTLFLLFLPEAKAQNKELFRIAEDSLKILAPQILLSKDDFVKYNANERFMILLESTLLSEKSFNYPFDSLKTISKLTSSDGRFRIFNWNLPKADGTFEYFGFIQVWNSRLKKYDVIKLVDKSDEIMAPETKILDNSNWYGVHYYKLIETKFHGKHYYTLLGWDGNNKEMCRKIIEPISFNGKNKAVFGSSIFKMDKKDKKTYKRIIFEYSASASMSLKYEKQFMSKGKDKNRMIIFDRLSPPDPALNGSFQFYVPETNIFDGFIFKNGKWMLIKDVDARNKTIKSRKPKKQSKYNHEFEQKQK